MRRDVLEIFLPKGQTGEFLHFILELIARNLEYFRLNRGIYAVQITINQDRKFKRPGTSFNHFHEYNLNDGLSYSKYSYMFRLFNFARDLQFILKNL